jgi:hypothetical protein
MAASASFPPRMMFAAVLVLALITGRSSGAIDKRNSKMAAAHEVNGGLGHRRSEIIRGQD